MEEKTKQKEINMLNDAMFKSLCRSIEVREIIVSFLHQLTNIDEELLKNADYQGGELVKKNLKEKKKESDLIIKIGNHNQLILEMNQYRSKNLFEKNTSYAFSVISESIPISVKRYPHIILINFDNFNRFQTKEEVITFKLRDEEGNIETDIYQSIHLILENIVNKKYNIDNEIEKFIRLLKMRTIEEMKREFKGDERYMAAIRKVEDLSKDPNFIGYYDREEAHKWDLEDMRETGYDEGEKNGIEKGMIQGEKKKQIEIARIMLKKNMDYKTISECTGLSMEKIKNL